MVKVTVHVTQKKNHNFKPAVKANETNNSKLVYEVTKVVNSVSYTIGQTLTPDEVRAMIAPHGIQVVVEGEKKRK